MDIEVLTITLAANQALRLEKSGRYFELIEAAYPLASIALSETDGGAVAFVRNAESGIYGEVPFSAIDLTNGADAQTVKLLLTDGRAGSRRAPGNVRVIDDVSSAVQTVGGSYTAIGTNALQIVAPASNLRGLVIRQVAVGGVAPALCTVNARIVAAPSAPALFTGNLLPLAPIGFGPSASGAASNYDLKKRIPPGWGLYFFTVIGGAVATDCSYSLSYELQ